MTLQRHGPAFYDILSSLMPGVGPKVIGRGLTMGGDSERLSAPPFLRYAYQRNTRLIAQNLPQQQYVSNRANYSLRDGQHGHVVFFWNSIFKPKISDLIFCS